MARKKKPENENDEQKETRLTFEEVSNHANRSEKTSWNRKMDNMVKLIAKLRPVEDKILTIIKEEKTPILDEISEVRMVMINECVHPFEYLIRESGAVKCRFCERKVGILNGNKT